MPALELLSGHVTAPSTTLTDLTMNGKDSLTVRNTPQNSNILLIQTWVDVQGAGTFRIKSPRLHDNVQAIRIDTVVSEVDPLLPPGFPQKLIPQDTLIAQLSGSATAGDIELAAMLLWYQDLPGIEGRFLSPDQVKQRLANILTIENTVTTGATGDYTGSEALNAEFDLLKGNTDYAIIGYLVDTECLAIAYTGSDWGNVRVGGPGNDTSKQLTANWFANISSQYSIPMIPVFNSANLDNINIEAVQDENGAAVTVTTIIAELS